MKFPDSWQTPLSGLMLILAFGADMAYALINMFSFATTIPGKILLPILGGVVVTYKALARQASKNLIWWIGAVLTFYFAVSFSLTELNPAIENAGTPNLLAIERENAYDAGDVNTRLPPALREAKAVYKKASDSLQALKDQQAGAGKEFRSYTKDVENPIQERQKEVDAARITLDAARASWLPLLEQELKSKTEQEHSALAVFSRLPVTLHKIVTNDQGNGLAWVLALFAFSALFAFVEGVLYVTCGPEGVIKKRPKLSKTAKLYRKKALSASGEVQLPAAMSQALNVPVEVARRLHEEAFAGDTLKLEGGVYRIIQAPQ